MIKVDILNAAVKYADELWNEKTNPIEHKRVREAFIDGALWGVKNNLELGGVIRSFPDWLKEATEIDKEQKFLLEYTEIIEWQGWYQKGLTPIEAVQLNYHNYG